MKRREVSIFTTSLIAAAVAVFFARSYATRRYPLHHMIIIASAIFIAMIITAIFILKPYGKLKKIFPEMRLLLAVAISAFLIIALFAGENGFQGFLFAFIFTMLLSEAEYTLREAGG